MVSHICCPTKLEAKKGSKPYSSKRNSYANHSDKPAWLVEGIRLGCFCNSWGAFS